MNEQNDTHLSEEQMMEIITGNGTEIFNRHIEACEECAHELEELRKVGEILKGVEDEEIPIFLERRILRTTYNHNRSAVMGILENPFLVTILAVVIVVILYFILCSLLIEQ